MQSLPEMQKRVATEGKPGEDVSHGWGKSKPMAGEAGGDEQALDASHRAEDRKAVGHERLDADPALHDGTPLQRRIDTAGDGETPVHAFVEDAAAVR